MLLHLHAPAWYLYASFAKHAACADPEVACTFGNMLVCLLWKATRMEGLTSYRFACNAMLRCIRQGLQTELQPLIAQKLAALLLCLLMSPAQPGPAQYWQWMYGGPASKQGYQTAPLTWQEQCAISIVCTNATLELPVLAGWRKRKMQ